MCVHVGPKAIDAYEGANVLESHLLSAFGGVETFGSRPFSQPAQNTRGNIYEKEKERECVCVDLGGESGERGLGLSCAPAGAAVGAP